MLLEPIFYSMLLYAFSADSKTMDYGVKGFFYHQAIENLVMFPLCREVLWYFQPLCCVSGRARVPAFNPAWNCFVVSRKPENIV